MEPINEASMGMASVFYFDTCNGSMLRQLMPRLYDYQKLKIRASLTAGGMTPRKAPEEDFYVGRTNYSRGVRLLEFNKNVEGGIDDGIFQG